MIQIKSNTYTCESCHCDNDIAYNIGAELVDGQYYESRQCYKCGLKYQFIDNCLYPIEKRKEPDRYDKNRSSKIEQNTNTVPTIAYIVVSLIVLSGVFFILDFTSKSRNKADRLETITLNNVSSKAPDPIKLTDSENTSKLSSNKSEYIGYFTLDSNGAWHPDNFIISIGQGQLTYQKNGETKYIDVINQGLYTREDQGATFKYQKFYMPKKDKYLLISHSKEVNHNGIFYYRLIIDGQTQLAL